MDFYEEYKKRLEKEQEKADLEPSNAVESNDTSKNELVIKEQENKQEIKLSDLSVADVKFKLDTSKGYEDQAQDVAMAMATAKAVQDENTAEMLSGAKKTELISSATEKVKKAQKGVIEAETEIQKAERESYEGILETFGFFRHLPRWLTKVIVYALTPFFILLGFIIGIPCGFIKILIDNIDGIICKYEKTGERSKPRIKVVIWVLLALIVVAAVCLTTLACLHII